MEFFDIGETEPPEGASDRVKAVFSAIRTARSAWSIGIDIEEACKHTLLAHSIIRDGAGRMWPNHWDNEPERGDAAGGLIKAALMAYWRAIDGGSEGRSSFPVDQAFKTPELKAAAERLRAQRNHSVAHHGVASEISITWHDDRITLMIDRQSGRAAITYPWFRWRARLETITDLANVLDALQPVAQDWLIKAQKKADAKIAWLARQGDLALLLTTPFVPEDFFSRLPTGESAANYRLNAQKQLDEAGFQIDLSGPIYPRHPGTVEP